MCALAACSNSDDFFLLLIVMILWVSMQVRISGMEDRNKTKVALKSPHIVGLF